MSFNNNLISFSEEDVYETGSFNILNEFDPLFNKQNFRKKINTFNNLKLQECSNIDNINRTPLQQSPIIKPINKNNHPKLSSDVLSHDDIAKFNASKISNFDGLLHLFNFRNEVSNKNVNSPENNLSNNAHEFGSKDQQSLTYPRLRHKRVDVSGSSAVSDPVLSDAHLSLFCVDEELQSFYKIIQSFSELLMPNDPLILTTQQPELLNAYLFDDVCGCETGLQIYPGLQKVANDWRISPILEPILDIVPAQGPTSVPLCKLPIMEVKIYIPFSSSSSALSSSQSLSLNKKLRMNSDPQTTTVTCLINLAVKSIFQDEPEIPNSTSFCLRICNRTDLLHPNAKLSDLIYVQNCHRQGTPVRVVMEKFIQQEVFLPSKADRAVALSLHEGYKDEYGIRPKQEIETSFSFIAKAIQEIRSLIENPLSQSKSVASKKKQLEQVIKAFTKIFCHEITLTSLLTSLSSTQKLMDEIFHIPKASKFEIGIEHVERSASQPQFSKDIFAESQGRMELELDKLEKQLKSQVAAFFKWKQAWHPDLNLSIIQSSAFSMNPKQRPLGIHEDMLMRNVHRTAKYTKPLIVGVMSVRNRDQGSRPSANQIQRFGSFSSTTMMDGSMDRTNPNPYIRVHLALSYAGRQLRYVCSRHFGPSKCNLDEHDFVANTIPVLGDSHFSGKAQCSRSHSQFPTFEQIDEWFRFSDFPINRIPREAILNISLVSLKKPTDDPAVLKVGTLLGWANVPLFDAFQKLRQGKMFVGLWPPISDISPAQRSTFSHLNRSQTCTVIELAFPDYKCELLFAKPEMCDNLEFSIGRINAFSGDARKATHQATESILLQNCDPRRSAISALEAYRNFQTVYRAKQHHGLPLPATSDLNRFEISSNRPMPDAEPGFISFLPRVKQEAVEVLWGLKGHLIAVPDALVALLIGAPTSWPEQCRTPLENNSNPLSVLWLLLLSQIYALLAISQPISPAHTLRLLAPDVADQCIRHWAVSCLSRLPSDALIPYLPGLLQCINYDIHMDWSGLVSLLMHRATINLRFCNALFWDIQNIVKTPTWFPQQRLLLMSSSIIWLRGSHLASTWKLQSQMLNNFKETAIAVKEQRNETSRRFSILTAGIDKMQRDLEIAFASNKNDPTTPSTKEIARKPIFRLLYDFGLATRSMNKRECDYFTSFTCPLQLVFHSIDAKMSSFSTMFKVGDDLRLDTLICQLMRVADSAWLSDGLDLRLIHFRVLPTEPQMGFIELVTECTTLRQIQEQNAGLRGAFNEMVLLEWLKNIYSEPNALEKALENFLLTAVGGCVLTYVLGIGDRHNDNILVRRSGHLFHIDFSKVFGNFQTIAGINRDRAPFALSPDMLRVIKVACSYAGSRDQDRLQVFTKLCCRAYQVLRKQAFGIISIMESVLQNRLPEITCEHIRYVYDALRPEDTDEEAEKHFRHQIQRSIMSKTTQVNFFMHGCAQKRTAFAAGPRSCPIDDSLKSPTVCNDNRQSGEYLDVFKIESNSDNKSVCKLTEEEKEFIQCVSVTRVAKKCERFVTQLVFSLTVWKNDMKEAFQITRTNRGLQSLIAVLQQELPDLPAVQAGKEVSALLGSSEVSEADVIESLQTWFDSLLKPKSAICSNTTLFRFLRPDCSENAKSSLERLNTSPVKLASLSTGGDRCWSHHPDQSQLSPKQKKQTSKHMQPSLVEEKCSLLEKNWDDSNLNMGIQLKCCLSKHCLKVLVNNGRNLAIANINSNVTYFLLRLGILPSSKRVPSVQKTFEKTSNFPVFNELFSFDINESEHHIGFLLVSVWLLTPSVGEQLLGEVAIPLSSIPPDFDNAPVWYELSHQSAEKV